MKVLQVIDTLGMGGAETWLMDMLRLWSRSGDVQMDFLITSGNRGIFDDEARELGAQIHYARFGRPHLLSFVPEYRRILARGYRAIHDHQAYVSGWHFLLGAGLLPSVRVAHVHNPEYQILNNYGVTPSRRLAAWLGKDFVGRFATHIAGTSREAIEAYGFNAPAFRHIPTGVLHCGIKTGRFIGDEKAAKAAVCDEFGWPRDARIIVNVGRIDQSADFGHPQSHKNTGFAVAVAIEYARTDLRARMIFAGEPSPAVAVLEARIAEAGLSGRIVFVGIRHDVSRLILGSDVMLFPSHGEGLGMVAVEAQAAGLPVIASTNVPEECVVIPGMVTFLEVTGDPVPWAAEAARVAERGRRDNASCNAAVRDSPFSIEYSARALRELYFQPNPPESFVRGGTAPHGRKD